MANKERKIEDYKSILVVEGYSDLLFYAEVLELLGKHESVFIKELGGRNGLKRKLETLVTPKLLAQAERLAFVIDADTNPQGTVVAQQTLLSKVTEQAVVEGNPKIGLLIVPNGTTKGEIETLVWQSWSADPANAAQRKCVEDYVACMGSQKVTAHSPDKGLIGALLALKSDEDPRLGPGARTKVFDLKRPELQRLRDFLSGF